MKPEKLVEMALEVREKAYARYSGFRVGAALLTKSGKVFTGVNVENASYGLTVCAERVAVFKAVSEGEREFVAIAIASDSPEKTVPCGACRQVLYEFSEDMDVIMANRDGDYEVARLKDLLPRGFRLGGDEH
ncbi:MULTISPECIES: cytidine deaminase [Thermotoga]|jgi:cytidine deaminase|uniref:cytidine deaminase n=1 Tax=Thermotoga TaxID=2335 RepID=UPI0005030D41|nr:MULTISPECIES: cytidine deaminase [Thermotoga]MDK2785348.1 cytidine deaminase [Thermotoga sp.]HBF10680.1 cytidine deaminase [Thermotoga neapolitana]AJG39936.1 cytidine deaminase [Thermotoga sp. RQ7]KFZ21012.1 cytidine deaminase [Thermotoga neapolitana LA10]MDK2950117.1 cytidine deaminase [Thermotoga sp.]